MNRWLERALISIGASIVSTTAIVTTAKNPQKKKRRRKKRRGQDARGKDGVRVDEKVPRSPGAQAAHDFRRGHDQGMTGAEFLESLTSSAKRAGERARFVGGLLGLGGGAKVPEPKEPRREAARGDAKKKRPKKKRPPEKDAFTELSGEAVKKAGRAAAKKAASDAIEGSAAFEAARRIKESVGETLESTGKTIKEAAGKIGESVKGAMGDEDGEGLGDKLDRGVKSFGRWVQGPGVPREEDARAKNRRPRSGTVVDAKDPTQAEYKDEPPDGRHPTG